MNNSVKLLLALAKVVSKLSPYEEGELNQIIAELEAEHSQQPQQEPNDAPRSSD